MSEMSYDFHNHRIVFREYPEELWYIETLEGESFSTLKRAKERVIELVKEGNRLCDLPVLVIDRFHKTHRQAVATRYEDVGVWVRYPNGDRRKERLDCVVAHNNDNVKALEKVRKLLAEAKAKADESDQVLAAIPRLRAMPGEVQ